MNRRNDDDDWLNNLIVNVAPVETPRIPPRFVCENHHDKAWPEECDCGPGMRYSDTLKAA